MVALMTATDAVPDAAPEDEQSSALPEHDASDDRLRAMVRDHLAFTWRSLRRLGLPADVADDAVQRVFLVASGKLASIKPGSERGF
jgi:hypothetical protein